MLFCGCVLLWVCLYHFNVWDIRSDSKSLYK